MNFEVSPEVQRRAARIKLVLMDCDGVLTDGRIWIFENGEEQKGFHTRDGMGIDLLHRAGLKSGIISGRTSSAVDRRGKDLGMWFIVQGCTDKERAFADAISQAGLRHEQVAYIGDDINDVSLIMQSGFGVAVSDAAIEARLSAHYVTRAAGGFGAVREVCEVILKAQGLWMTAKEK